MPFTFQYMLSNEMKATLQKADAINDFARWFGLTGMSFDVERRNADLGRLIHYLPAHLPPQNEQQIMAFVNGQDEEVGPDAQRLLNIRKALQFCRVAEEPFGIPVLQKIHNILLNKLPEANTGAMLRNIVNEPAALYPPSDKLDQYREVFTALANNKEIHPVVRVWLLYYFLVSVHFFDFENEALAIIFCYYFLQREGYGFKHLLRLEKFVLHSKKYMAYSINYMEGKDYKELFTRDLSAYLEACLQGFENNLAYIREMFTASVKKRLEYPHLSPRLKNSVNFWLEQGYFHHRHKLAGLNARQRDLLFRLYTGTEFATSDIAVIYNIDKKTIHDDMAVLMQSGVAVLKGGGKSAKFGLNFDLRGK